jgi:glycine dehydrogenase subunit 1
MHPYLPLTDTQRKAMLKDIGVGAFKDLLNDIPRDVPRPKISLPEPLSEQGLEKEMRQIAALNRPITSMLSFLGAGTYEHYIPAVVPHLASRGEFFTAYTPYQAEASQGTLQVIYEYQTMMASLTGMDVCNASHYDGATSFAESVIIAMQQTQRTKVIITASIHPDYRKVLRTYLSSYDCEIVEIGFTASGVLDRGALERALAKDVACCAVQSPNFFGVIENFEGLRERLDAVGACFIMVVNPMSLGVLRSPGEWGADIACGDAQVFGNPPSFGGPHLGFIACKEKLMRRLCGRLAGMTEDAEGKRAFVLTLQAREQHIRRERASSNICSNQALCALKTCVYLASVGDKGLRTIAENNVRNTDYLRNALKKVSGCKVLFDAPVFNEFVIQTALPAQHVIEACVRKGIFPGVALENYYPALKNCLLVCVTETKNKEDIDRFVSVIKESEKNT